MYTRPAATVGLASSRGAGLPGITGGCQCHTWMAEAAFDGVNAVAGLTELCCGPCRYCGQSRPAPDAAAPDTGLATATGADSTKPASPSSTTRTQNPIKRPDVDIARPLTPMRKTAPKCPPARQTALPPCGQQSCDRQQASRRAAARQSRTRPGHAASLMRTPSGSPRSSAKCQAGEAASARFQALGRQACWGLRSVCSSLARNALMAVLTRCE